MIKHIFKLIWNKRRSNALILIEIFLAFLVLFAVLSYVIYNMRMLSAPLGFETKDKWMVYLDDLSSKDSLEVLEMKNTLHRELLNLDNIESVSYTENINPYSGNQSRTGGDAMGFNISSLLAFVDSDFANALDMNVVQGRWFQEEDLNSTYPSIILNQAFIDEYFGGKNMIDSMLLFRGEHKVIGVVDAFRYLGEFSENQPHAFYQVPRHSKEANNLVLGMAPNTPAAYEEKVNNLISDITKSSSFIIKNIDQMKKSDSRDTWIPLIALLSICGFLCINVALGLFGVLWYNINKRRGEIGLRRAVGAHSSDISKQFIFEILILTFIAVFLGIFFAIQVPLLKIGPLEPINMYYAIAISTGIILTLVTLCALHPSWQASKLHPATALHED
ncbi:MAG: FtsX-like permease family protein [Saprospiraceae bacterium]|nr:FtsX-like permease family protein [Saprospiraceae bacterium]